MSKLDDLITELCPDGVEYKRLGDIGTIIRGNGLQRKDFTESGVGCIHYGQIYTYYSLFTSETKSFVSPELATKLQKVKTGDIIIAVTGENVDDICKCVVWLGQKDIVIGGHSAIFRHNQNPKYIAYWLQSASFFEQKQKIAQGTKVIDVQPKKLERIILPLPPLSVQSEIVRILDTFTELTEELTEELTARRKQYEYYRDKILTFTEGVEYRTLGDVTHFSKHRICASSVDNTTYVSVENLLSNKMGKTNANHVPLSGNLIGFKRGDILIGNIRPYLKKIWFADCEGGTNGDVLTIQINDKSPLTPKFLYHLLSSEPFFTYIIQNSKGAKMPRGDKSAVMKYLIPLPPLEVQEYIVSILDRFDKLCNDLTQGLPAEINARRKQYEYYRDTLLTLKQKEITK